MMIYFCNYFVLFVNIVFPSLVIANFYNRASFPKSFVGSNLFGDGHFVKKCFSIEDVALLSARSKFEAFVPNFTSISQTDLENDRSVEQMLEYLEEVGRLVNSTDTVGNVQYITQAAYYDVIGGYLHFYYLPFVKFSFYAGTLTYRNTLKVYNFQSNCKQNLNTHGNGWRMSTFKFLKMQYKIPPINIRSKGMESETNGVFKDPCGNLLLASDDDYTSDYSDRELIVSLPRIEPVDNDSIINVWLPFKHKRNFILNSKSSAFVLTRYYVDVLKCYQFRNMMSNPFSRRFKKLLHEKVLPLIQNDEFYPGFGAILRVLETLKGSSLNPRGIHQYDIDSDEFWDDTASLVDEADPNLIVSGINEAKKAETVNETNVFLKVVDSITGYEMQWNEKQKTKYICLAIVVMIIGLLMILLCIFISRELRKTNVNTSTLTRERKNNWKTLLRKLSQKSGKNELDSELNSESDLRYPPKHEDTTSDSAPVKPTTSLINPTEYRHTSSARHKRLKHKTSIKKDYSSSSSSTSNSTKSKKRKIYRKIRDEMKQSRYYGNQIHGRRRSIYSTLELPQELKQDYNFKIRTEVSDTKQRKKNFRRHSSSCSEMEVHSSGWETLSSSKVVGNVKNSLRKN